MIDNKSESDEDIVEKVVLEEIKFEPEQKKKEPVRLKDLKKDKDGE